MALPIFKLLLCLVFTSLFIFGLVSQYRYEKRRYNKGICPKCGSKLKSFDQDSSGAYGFTCPRCRHTVWVSFSNILKDNG